MKKNILICSVGKRVSLVKIFKRVAKEYDKSIQIYSTDMNPAMAPAVLESDGGFAVPKVIDTTYCEKLLSICLANSIGMIVPTIDTELFILSKNRELFEKEGICVIVSNVDFIDMCRDKRKTNDLFQSLGIRVPKPVDINQPIFPLFAKPYDGSLSKDIHVLHSIDQLTQDIVNNPKLMFMEYIDPSVYKEYTIDLYYGRDNRLKSVVPRERIEIRAGEINKGKTVKNVIVQFIREHMEYMDGVIGCICLQLFYNTDLGDIVAIEINPRFGGGYPLSYYAGANFPSNLIKEYFLSESISYDETWDDNTLMLRYDAEIIIK